VIQQNYVTKVSTLSCSVFTLQGKFGLAL